MWIQEFGCIKKQEFNFNYKYIVQYKENKIFYIKREHIQNFFGNQIFNISAIVGNNGSGKTTLLNCIIELLTYGNQEVDVDCILGFEIEGVLKFFYTKESETIKNIEVIDQTQKSNNKTYVQFLNKNLNSSIISKELKYSKVIFINSILNIEDYLYKKVGQICDFSLGGLIRKDYNNMIEMKYRDYNTNIIVNFYNCDIYRQIYYVLNSEKNKEFLPFELPDRLKITFENNRENVEEIEKGLPESFNMDGDSKFSEYRLKINNIFYKNNKSNEDFYSKSSLEKWIFYIVRNLIMNAFKSYAKLYTTNDDKERKCIAILDAYKIYDGEDNLLDYCLRFLEDASRNLSSNDSYVEVPLNNYIQFVKWLKDEDLEALFDFDSLNSELFFVKRDDLAKFKEFFMYYQSISFPFPFLNFSWGLSSGEYNFLSMFARLYSVVNENNLVINHFPTERIECKNIFLLIDEADMTFHPEWQRKYIKILTDFLPKIYKCKIQIIFSTHSPILLSDIPSKNVIYLTQVREMQARTFAQNIHTLFKDTFVLEDTLGEFVRNKLINVNTYLDNVINNDDTANATDENGNQIMTIESAKIIIDMVEEPVLKKAIDIKYNIASENRKNKRIEIMNQYDMLSEKERKIFLQYIIDSHNDKGEL